jgi:GH35 family endo-1,4-beta-xylanase
MPLLALLLLLVALPAHAGAPCKLALRACLTAAGQDAQACRSECRRRGDAACATACREARDVATTACRAVTAPCDAVCGADVAPATCSARIGACRDAVGDQHRVCRRACRAEDAAARPGCVDRCRRVRALGEGGCGYVTSREAAGEAMLPELPPGRAADTSLLEPEELALLAESDARAASLRTRRVRLWIGRPGTAVDVRLTKHAFPFGFPIDRTRHPTAEDLDWFGRTMADHFGLVVIENSQKWRAVEELEGVRTHARADADVAWAEGLGLPVKGHALMWGIVPPFSSSGVPPWALSRFAGPVLSPADAAALRDTVRRHVSEMVTRYRGRIATWDATNETLQPFAQWFVERLGPGIVDDVFRWAHAADPDARLVFNEWIVEVFTGLTNPTAADVRDRVLALRAAGVPVHAIGQQAHFVPTVAFAGIPVDLSQRTRIDDYAVALDTLAQAGLPIHITETNIIAPDDPERRAAQFEGLLRLWWGHPAVEQIVFWGPWNTVAGRDEFDVGLWDEARQLTRHGEAVLSLLNDRWRTQVHAVADASGVVEFTATHGEHIASWTADGTPVHARFRVAPGSGTATVAAIAD